MSIWNDVEPNPYDPTTSDFTPETVPLDEIIRQAISAAMLKMRVHLPGQIVNIRGNQKVDVLPLLQTRYIDNTVVNLPVIQNVMVSMPQGKNYSIKLPIAVGDTGSLLFCDRSLDVWSVGNGGVVDPQDSRSHDLSDPVFIPGLVPFSQQTTDSTTDLVLTNGVAQLRLEANGALKLQNTNSNQELISLVDTLVTILTTASTVGGGPFTPDVVVKLQNVLVNLQTLEGI